MNKFKGLPIITMPKGFEKIAKRKQVKMEKQKLMNKERGEIVIQCKNKNRNFYLNQDYGNATDIPMACSDWNHYYSKGDYFTIKAYNKMPAFSEAFRGTFKNFGLEEPLLQNLRKLGFMTPTNIQGEAIPHILKGCNTFVSAETGNGKTHAYLIPLVNQLLKRKAISDPLNEINKPKSLIILPSRELADQTRRMAMALTEGMDFRVNCEIGGCRLDTRLKIPIAKSPDILVGSFGILSKLFTVGAYNKSLVKHIVLDEIDTLFDDSFASKLTHFLSRFSMRVCPDGDAYNPDTNSGTQLTLACATMPTAANNTLNELIDNRYLVQVKTPSLHMLPTHVRHTFFRVGRENRDELIVKKIKSLTAQKKGVMVFTATSKTSLYLQIMFTDLGVDTVELSAKTPRQQRKEALRRFLDGSVHCIICTDLASRGLNTVNAHCVINYQMPKFMSDYIHRAGRVGRVGSPKNCEVVNFVRPHDKELVKKIEYSIRKSSKLPDVNANIKQYYNDLHPEQVNETI